MKLKINAIFIYLQNKITFWLDKRTHFGAFRFKLIRLIYKLNPYFPETRNKRWDFILEYLPRLQMVCFRGIKVLDIGCIDSLLIYEIAKRGYDVTGMDIRNYPVKLPKNIEFVKADIVNDIPNQIFTHRFHYIIATSIIELLGTKQYGNENIDINADRKAIENIHELLENDGYFILSLPIAYWRSMTNKAYTLGNIMKLINGLFTIFEITQRGGNICLVLIKLLKDKDNNQILYAYEWKKKNNELS